MADTIADELVRLKNDPDAFKQRCWENRDFLIRALRRDERYSALVADAWTIRNT